MTFRNLDNGNNTDLRDSLLEGDVFVYAHLVKFEKPLKVTADIPSRDRTTYTYVTDASYDIKFDDGSVNANGLSNQEQTYRANRLLNVSSITETIEARASSFSLTMDAAALSTSASNVTITINTVSNTLELTSGEDWVDLGFIEGHEIKSDNVSWNSGVTFRLDRFTNDNKTAHYTVVDGVLTVTSGSTSGLSFSLNNRELSGLILDREDPTYSRYINREVFIYKAHINPNTGEILSAPFLVFKGIISSGKQKEDVLGKPTVTWSVTSHWGDFINVNGRLTSDTEHRAVGSSGLSDLGAVKRKEYATDLGFMHSEQAINLIAIYQVKETRYKQKKKSSWFGLKKSYKLIEYEVEVDREADLRFNLSAKYLPVVYGVQQVDAIPFFVDTDKNDSTEVYVAYALCEGEVHSLFDIYFDGQSSICLSENDSDTRSVRGEDNAVAVLCTGRMDRGDVLLGENPFATVTRITYPTDDYEDDLWWDGEDEVGQVPPTGNAVYNPITGEWETPGRRPNAVAQNSTIGVKHAYGRTFDDPIDARLIFYAGRPNQLADNFLLSKALNQQFKIQTSYFDGDKARYWGPNHRVLDTAYVVAKYKINEGESEIPELDFVVKGKLVDCHNYDYSYRLDPVETSADLSNWGKIQFIPYYDADGVSQGNLRIAAIYDDKDENGITQYRVRFTEDPGLTRFSISKNGDANTRAYFVADTHEYLPLGTVPETLEETATSTSTGSNNQGTDVTIDSTSTVADVNASSEVEMALTTDLLGDLSEADLNELSTAASFNLLSATPTGNTDTNGTIESVGTQDLSTSSLTALVLVNAVAIPNTVGSVNASTVDDFYIGAQIELTRIDADGSSHVQVRTIVDYLTNQGDNNTKVAVVNAPWDVDYIPVQGDKVRIIAPKDRRVSTNPAMQLLDYMTNTRYGRGLSLEEDINLDTFKETARQCDTRSDVTVHFRGNQTTGGSSAPVQVGDIFEDGWTNNNVDYKNFRGTVKSATYISETNTTEVIFTDVLGKIISKWNNWKAWGQRELFYINEPNSGSVTRVVRVDTAGTVFNEAPIPDAAATAYTYLAASNEVTLRRVNRGSQDTLEINYPRGGTDADYIGDSFAGNAIVKFRGEGGNLVDGYSLYDSDEVPYWRYLGWNDQDQEYVTRHQTNIVVDTSKSVFDNVNSILSHFNGILRYNNGRYDLDVKSKQPDTIPTLGTSTPSVITEDDIIGTINIEDAGNRGTYNTVSASIPDPQNRFENRSVTFLNSTYLKEDRNIPKKGDVKAPGITNYYNARLAAKQALEESRYGLKISFTMPPKGYLLLAGELIYITNERLGFTNKPFRINNLTLTQDCLVKITAEEHNNEAYLVPEGDSETGSFNPAPPATATIGRPEQVSNLTATSNKQGGIELEWDYPGLGDSPERNGFNTITDVYEVWRGLYPDYFGVPDDDPPYSTLSNPGSTKDDIPYQAGTEAVLIGTTKEERYVDPVLSQTDDTDSSKFYYWVRIRRSNRATSVSGTNLFGDFFPPSDGMQTLDELARVPGIQGLSLIGLSSISVDLTNSNANVQSFSSTFTLTNASVVGNTITTGSDHSFNAIGTDITLTGSTASPSNDGTYEVTGFTDGTLTVTPNFPTTESGISGSLKGTVVNYEATTTQIFATSGSTALTYNDTVTLLVGATGLGLVEGDVIRQKISLVRGTVVSVSEDNSDGTTIVVTVEGSDLFNETNTLEKRTAEDPETFADLSGTLVTNGSYVPEVTYPGLVFFVSNIAATNCQAPDEVIPSPLPNPRTSVDYGEISDFGAPDTSSPPVRVFENAQNAFVDFTVTIRDSEANQTSVVKRFSIGKVIPGNEGDKGALGDKGGKGDSGVKGDPGAPGDKGDKGDKGSKGFQGQQGDQGDKGDKGSKGSKGFQGQQGDQGDKGDKGDKGLKGFKGQQGDQGDKGDKGDKGLKGFKGQQGDQGEKGDKGDKGLKGFKGQQGDQGEKGDKGDKGLKGFKGQQGDQGAKGETGDKGLKGFKGQQGDQGEKGTKGVIGDQGAKGQQGDQGAKGTKGVTGDQGAKGQQGDQGAKGIKGVIGDQGAKGQQGDQGAKGIKGVIGDQGAKGQQGDQGAKGIKGVIGDQGAKGQQGDQGAKGTKGVTGDEGAKGQQGDQGTKGTKGVTGDGGAKGQQGDQGTKGAQGEQGTKGLVGQQGDKGIKGVSGPQGDSGVKGDPGEDVLIIYYDGLEDDDFKSPATVDRDNKPTAPDMDGGSTSISAGFRITDKNGDLTNWYTEAAVLTDWYFIASAVVPSFTQAPRSEWTVSGYLQGEKGETGAKGAPGQKGETGDKGIKGLIGQQGNQGAKGETGDKGIKGLIGQQGNQGAKGETGDKGIKGLIGQQGNQGAKGETGDKGIKGLIGQQGNQGAKGETGDKGIKGLIGQQGDQGDKGDTGDKGIKGLIGQQGDQGDKGDTGDKGIKGFQGQQGDQGDKGDTGDKGIKGFQGQQGDQGDKGDAGDKGIKGFQGQQGDQGDKGTKGDEGLKGFKGQQGDQGDKGLKGTGGDKGIKGPVGDEGDKGGKGNVGVKGTQGSPGADAPYVVLNFTTGITTDTARNNVIKNFSGLTTVLKGSVFWDATQGEVYQNKGAEAADPSLTLLNSVLNGDSIVLGSGSDRLEISNTSLRAYASNTLRVVLGRLSDT